MTVTGTRVIRSCPGGVYAQRPAHHDGSLVGALSQHLYSCNELTSKVLDNTLQGPARCNSVACISMVFDALQCRLKTENLKARLAFVYPESN